MHHIGFISFLEMPIHISIYETEDNGFVTYQCLVVAFTIGYCLFIRTAIFHLPENTARLPILILQLLDGLDPEVRDIHCHTIIKTITTIIKLCSQPRHTAHLFCNSDSIWIHLMNQLIGKCQITDGIVILATIKIVTVVDECLT